MKVYVVLEFDFSSDTCSAKKAFLTEDKANQYISEVTNGNGTVDFTIEECDVN